MLWGKIIILFIPYLFSDLICEQEDENRRMFATGTTVNHPLNFTSTHRNTMWAFHTDGVFDPEKRSGRTPPVLSDQAKGSKKNGNSARDEARRVGTEAEAFNATRGTVQGNAPSEWGGKPSREFNPLGGSFGGNRGNDGTRQGEGVGKIVSSENEELGDPDNGGQWFARGSGSGRRRSKTCIHDGVLEVVAVEGVLHLGQIQASIDPPFFFHYSHRM